MIFRLGGFARRLLQRSETGVAAVEFALLVPFMTGLFLTATDVLIGLTVARRTTFAVNTIAEMISQSPGTVINSVTTNAVNQDQITLAMNSVITTMPNVLGDAASQKTITNWSDDITIIVSEADFTIGATPGVANVAALAWSVGNKVGGSSNHTRPCGTPTEAASDSFALMNGTTPVLTTLPNSLYLNPVANSVIVVDLVYTFNPACLNISGYSWLQAALTFHRVAYLPARLFYKLTFSATSPSGNTPSPPLTYCGNT